MQIPVIVEPAFRPSSWCRQTLSGMYAEAKKKKYTLYLLGCQDSLSDELNKLSSPRIAIVVGTSITFVPDVLQKLEALNIQALLVNYDNFSLSASHSVVRMDYVNAMQRLLGYFSSLGKSRIALLGINTNSSADTLKEQYFLAMQNSPDPQRHVFRNNGSIRECIHTFLPHAHQYDALLCANDLVAVVISDKSKKKFSVVRIVTDVAFVAIGFALGGSFGVGTLICAACVGPVAGIFLPINGRLIDRILKKVNA